MLKLLECVHFIFLIMALLLSCKVHCLNPATSNCSYVGIASMSGDSPEECYFLHELPSIKSNSEVRFYASEIFLTATIEVVDIYNVSVVGYNNTVVMCSNDTQAGLLFRGIQNLVIESIEVHNCGLELNIDNDSYKNIRASIVIQECGNVWIMDSAVKNGPGTGLSLFNIKEAITVLNSTFESNGYDRESGGNGVYLEVCGCSKGLYSSVHYNFMSCKFIGNKADTGRDSNISGFSRFDKGGGLCCLIRSNSHKTITVTIEDSLISGNTARINGGGTFAAFYNGTKNGVFSVRESSYSQNHATYGGAHFSSYLHNQHLGQQPLNCTYMFETSTFTENWAVFGGGFGSSSTSTKEPSNKVNFKECVWRHNSAQFGSAVSILPHAWNIHVEGYMPLFIFSDCTIDSNYVQNAIDYDGESHFVKQHSQGSGALFCNDHKLQFSNHATFSSNNGSALHASSCTIRFCSNSETTFSQNTAYYGGAIHLQSSLIQLDENVRLLFKSNSAFIQGGAIYQDSFHIHMYRYSRTCFFRNTNTNLKDPRKRNILVSFTDNSAGAGSGELAGYTGYASGHSIYAYSLLPCHRYYKFQASMLTAEIFNEVGNFTYAPYGRPNEIATDANHTHIEEHADWELTYMPIIPGKAEKFSYSDFDDLGHNTTTVYQVTIKSENSTGSNVTVDPAYQYMTQKRAIFHGNASSEATIVLTAQTSRWRALSFRVKMLPCPPGFTLQLDPAREVFTCQCAENQYSGIQRCQSAQWMVYITPGYWFGYQSNKSESEDTLETGQCPIRFCTNGNNNGLLLPPKANRDKLNDVICADTRMGALCGKCKENNSVYYHSLGFECKPNRGCRVGWLLYILTEILPVTVIFVIIIFFNISFTSGVANGFIFYSQVVVMLRITNGGMIPFPPTLFSILRFLYLGFSLDPLVIDELSFCLFENASALDVLVLSYITLVYSFFLIIGTVVFVNKLSTRHCWQKCTSSKRAALQGDIIHGLSTLLVLCYAKCARASILLISPASIQGKGSQHSHYVVLYNGEVTWFSSEHLPYAIPATVMIVFVVVAPPILLLVYPMHYKILGLLKMAESRYARIVFGPFEKLKPLMDSFQGCFKDEFRFFSGLYYFYRLSILIIITFSKVQDMYFLLSGQLLFMLLMHMICQPYRKQFNNVMDSLLLFNLVTINGLTMYNSTYVSYNIGSNMINAISWIQALLVLLPLVAMFLYVLRRGVLHWKRLLCKVSTQNKEPEDKLPARLVQELSILSETDGGSYKRMH